MSIVDLVQRFREAQTTPEYQFEKIMVDLTEQICEIMETRGISRDDLARKLGKSRAWVTRILRGDHRLTLKTITDIFWAFGYKVIIKVEVRCDAEPDVSD